MRSSVLWLLGTGLSSLTNACGESSDKASPAQTPEECGTYQQTVRDCYDSACQSSGSSFCACWNQQQDLNAETCRCTPLRMELICQRVDTTKIDPTRFDCVGAMALLERFCTTP